MQSDFVYIYKPTRNAMQSGSARTKKWRIMFERDSSKYDYDLMNWVGSKDTKSQIKLEFDSEAAAVDFAKRKKWQYKIIEPSKKVIPKKSYAANFS